MKDNKTVTPGNLAGFLAENEGRKCEVRYSDPVTEERRLYEIRDGVMRWEISGYRAGEEGGGYKESGTLSPEEILKVIEKYPEVFRGGKL